MFGELWRGLDSEALAGPFTDIAADLDQLDLDSADVRKVAEVVAANRAVFDEITELRLLSGDLWTVNCLLSPSAPAPVISGVLDFDRSLWGDSAADRTIRMAVAKQDERTAFWARLTLPCGATSTKHGTWAPSASNAIAWATPTVSGTVTARWPRSWPS
ncbi:hypothetical protein ACFQY7_17200 [Actinomadura luteofluorescens]|uniref:Aminoglycoside phosphotransferase (APT) family kinase protein n=1 Tax=Actinomadura luteofluorescens TaxID=46163 RepID=A0A7Y9JLU0_9ACTN|nr:hypothetical protein [Actinomadura luteofluorescens]NYD51864.1 aminoglycoside phosphotransferase (APT) family kinase protein [Actinomadura luteofluorescens]